jgi:hypothetical protein
MEKDQICYSSARKLYNENECVKLSTYNFKIAKDYTYFGIILTNKNELRPGIEKRITNAN